MTTNMAVLTRVGIIPAAAALLLTCQVAVRAEESPAADGPGATTAAAQTPGGDTGASKSDEAKPEKDTVTAKETPEFEASISAASSPATDADKGLASSKRPLRGDAEAPEAAASDPGKTAEEKAVSSEKPVVDEAGTAKSAASEPAKSGEEDASAAKAPDDGAGSASAATATPEAPASADTAAKPATADEQKPEEDAPAKAATSPSPQEPVEASTKAATTPPKETAALPEASPGTPSGGVSDQSLPPADPIIAGVVDRLSEGVRGANQDDLAALTAFYGGLNGSAVWVSASGLTTKGKDVVDEIRKADDWGLNSSDFALPHLTSGAIAADVAAEAELTIAAAILKYARYARGGRINPSSISQLMDQSPTLRAPSAVLTEIAETDAPDAYLRSLHPKHEQFQLLRKALLKLRGTDEKVEEPEEDPALSVKLPPGRLLRAGMEDPQVALLRKRLKVPAVDAASENVYDDRLQEAVVAFQRANRLRPDAIIGNNTRAVLNGAPKPPAPSSESKIERILINMERWRWMPENLGEFYVWDNVPEFLTRVVKNNEIIHTDKIIVGQPSWPTPIFSADMKMVVFNPQWGVPNGIKTKELWPLLRKSSGAGFFGIFGGGYSSQAVLDAYDLRVSYNGRPIDANQVDWNSVDIRSYSFTQPPGPKNVLGIVKFMFPNRHDVYMHDTPERHLFVKSFRALSHGCMRVEEPRRFAEIILAQDKGWSPAKVGSMFGGYSNQVTLDAHIPVHVTYFTARVDKDGKLRTYGDFYGLDSRTAAALTGRNVRFEPTSYPDDVTADASSAPQRSPQVQRKKQYQGPPTLTDAISNMFSP